MKDLFKLTIANRRVLEKCKINLASPKYKEVSVVKA